MLRILLFTLMLSPLTAFGCSCLSEAKTFEEEIKEYDAIFTGVALETDLIPGDWDTAFYKTRMKVIEVWKDKAVTDSVYIKTRTERDSCGEKSPTIGNRFIVFSNVTKDGLHATGGCSTFIDLDQFETDMASLSSEEKAVWQSVLTEMWAGLGKPKKVHSK